MPGRHPLHRVHFCDWRAHSLAAAHRCANGVLGSLTCDRLRLGVPLPLLLQHFKFAYMAGAREPGGALQYTDPMGIAHLPADAVEVRVQRKAKPAISHAAAFERTASTEVP